MEKKKKKKTKINKKKRVVRERENIFMIGTRIVDYFKYCFSGVKQWGGDESGANIKLKKKKKKCFVYFSLPLRMFCSPLQSIDNQNVFGRGEWGREGVEGGRRKSRIDSPLMLCRSAMLSLCVPKRTLSNISSARTININEKKKKRDFVIFKL